MSDPFLGEIRIFPFDFAPRGWAVCDGQLLPISQNTALFSLLGTMYGGNGKNTFALPNLQGAAPICKGQGPGLSDYTQGQEGGSQSITLLSSEMPAHDHQAQGVSKSGDQDSPTNNTWAIAQADPRSQDPMYGSAGASTMSPFALSVSGGSIPHNNMPPYVVLNFCIAMQGIFPARN